MKGYTKHKASKDELRLLVAASSAISSVGVANGRNIPVVFVPSDEDKKIDTIISFHEDFIEGSCLTSWGITDDEKFVVLYLGFQHPVKQKVVLFFDILQFGIVVDQIMHAQCMFLTVGDETSKLSLCLHQKRILVDIYCDDFKAAWSAILEKQYTKHLRKKYKLSKKNAKICFEKTLQEWDLLKKIRLNPRA